MTEEKLSQPDAILRKFVAQIPKYHKFFASDEEEIEYNNLWADLWRSVIGVNVMPEQFKGLMQQDIPIPYWQHIAWKNQGAYKDGTAVADEVKWLQPDKARVFRARKGDSLVCRIDGKRLVVEKVDIQSDIIDTYNIDPKSTWPYKIEKKRKRSGRGTGPLTPSSSFYGDE
jgi:hypothetical protein